MTPVSHPVPPLLNSGLPACRWILLSLRLSSSGSRGASRWRGRGVDTRPRPCPASRGGTCRGSAEASLHVTLVPNEHGGGHRVSAAPVPGRWQAARRGGLGLPASSPRRRAAAPPVELCGRGQRASSRGAAGCALGVRGIRAPLPAAGWSSGPPRRSGPTRARGGLLCGRGRSSGLQARSRPRPSDGKAALPGRPGRSAPGRRWYLKRAPNSREGHFPACFRAQMSPQRRFPSALNTSVALITS